MVTFPLLSAKPQLLTRLQRDSNSATEAAAAPQSTAPASVSTPAAVKQAELVHEQPAGESHLAPSHDTLPRPVVAVAASGSARIRRDLGTQVPLTPPHSIGVQSSGRSVTLRDAGTAAAAGDEQQQPLAGLSGASAVHDASDDSTSDAAADPVPQRCSGKPAAGASSSAPAHDATVVLLTQHWQQGRCEPNVAQPAVAPGAPVVGRKHPPLPAFEPAKVGLPCCCGHGKLDQGRHWRSNVVTNWQ